MTTRALCALHSPGVLGMESPRDPAALPAAARDQPMSRRALINYHTVLDKIRADVPDSFAALNQFESYNEQQVARSVGAPTIAVSPSPAALALPGGIGISRNIARIIATSIPR
jgi:hypothetical protein